MSTALIAAFVVVLLLLALWAQRRARRLREQAQEREDEALARLRTGQSPGDAPSDTMMMEAGLPSRLPVRGGIEVAEVGEVVDLDALLAGEPAGVANRARERLEEPTNISLGDDTLPPRPAAPVNGHAHAAPRGAAQPQRPAPESPVRTAATQAAAAARLAAAPLSPSSPAPAAPAVQRITASAAPARAPLATPAPVRAAAPQPAVVHGHGPASLPERVVQAMQSAPVNGAHAGANGSAPAARVAAPVAALRATPAAARSAVTPTSSPASGGRGEDVPLRELTLAWFEARGYRSSPASIAVRPIELVLRHRHDPARAYAFVVETNRVSAERVQQLRTQARSIGLLRVLIVADGGAERGAADKSKGVRLMDRALLASEFEQLDFSVAAKIIAVARKRAAPARLH